VQPNERVKNIVPYCEPRNHCREGQFEHKSETQKDSCGLMCDQISGCC